MADSESKGELPTLSSSLLNRLRDMNPDGWGRLVEVFGPIVYDWCRKAHIAEHDAADVVQEVFTSVARGIDRFHRQEPGESFRNWLATITRNRIRDHYRNLNRRPVALGGSDALAKLHEIPDIAEATSATDVTASRISRRVLDLLQAEFEVRTWRAFWLTSIDGRDAADVANELDMSLASVYQSKSRVLRRLRQRLTELPT